MQHNKNILIVAVGNTLMGDDGIGDYVASGIEAQQLPGVQVIRVQQLTSDLLEEMVKADHTILVDASVQEEPVQFYKINLSDPAGGSHSHYTSAVQLLKMAQLVYKRELSVYTCAVGVTELFLQEALSVTAKKNADLAVSTILGWINGHEN